MIMNMYKNAITRHDPWYQ